MLCFCSLSFAANKKGLFITKYDDVKDVTYITHKSMQIGFLYNLRDSITGERENLRLYIMNNNLVLSVNYQYRNWAFFKTAVFLGNGSRLTFNFDQRISNVISGTVLREQYDYIMNDDDIDRLFNLLSAGVVNIAFIGDYTTDKMKIPAKVSAAMIDTIKKYKELKK